MPAFGIDLSSQAAAALSGFETGTDRARDRELFARQRAIDEESLRGTRTRTDLLLEDERRAKALEDVRRQQAYATLGSTEAGTESVLDATRRARAQEALRLEELRAGIAGTRAGTESVRDATRRARGQEALRLDELRAGIAGTRAGTESVRDATRRAQSLEMLKRIELIAGIAGTRAGTESVRDATRRAQAEEALRRSELAAGIDYTRAGTSSLRTNEGINRSRETQQRRLDPYALAQAGANVDQTRAGTQGTLASARSTLDNNRRQWGLYDGTLEGQRLQNEGYGIGNDLDRTKLTADRATLPSTIAARQADALSRMYGAQEAGVSANVASGTAAGRVRASNAASEAAVRENERGRATEKDDLRAAKFNAKANRVLAATNVRANTETYRRQPEKFLKEQMKNLNELFAEAVDMAKNNVPGHIDMVNRSPIFPFSNAASSKVSNGGRTVTYYDSQGNVVKEADGDDAVYTKGDNEKLAAEIALLRAEYEEKGNLEIIKAELEKERPPRDSDKIAFNRALDQEIVTLADAEFGDEEYGAELDGKITNRNDYINRMKGYAAKAPDGQKLDISSVMQYARGQDVKYRAEKSIGMKIPESLIQDILTKHPSVSYSEAVKRYVDVFNRNRQDTK